MYPIAVAWSQNEVTVINDLRSQQLEDILFKHIMRRWGNTMYMEITHIPWYGVAEIVLYRHPQSTFGFDAIMCDIHSTKTREYIVFTIVQEKHFPDIRRGNNESHVWKIISSGGCQMRSQVLESGVLVFYRKEKIFVGDLPTAIAINLSM